MKVSGGESNGLLDEDSRGRLRGSKKDRGLSREDCRDMEAAGTQRLLRHRDCWDTETLGRTVVRLWRED